MELLSMTDFVLSLTKNNAWSEQYAKCVRYVKFLKQPLEMGMFVPCHDNTVLEYPNQEDYTFNTGNYILAMDRYDKASEKVLFRGFKHQWLEDLHRLESDNRAIIFRDFDDYFHSRGFKTIEDLLHNTHKISSKIILTPLAIKSFEDG